ncbi:MAG: RDD family protein [Actinomycetota bacterium]|nr:RDD family protein [Actinomycetota bacterium]
MTDTTPPTPDDGSEEPSGSPSAPGYGPPPYSPPPYNEPGYGAPGYGPPPYSPPPYNEPGYGLTAGPADSLGRPLAAWWQRAVAIIVDMLILSVPTLIVSSLLNRSASGAAGTSGSVTGPLVELISLAITLAYFGWLDGGQTGQTVGKRMLGIATRDANTGGPIGTWRAVLRRFIYVILFALFFVPGALNALSPLWDRRRQAWHDKAATSDVVRLR